MAPGTFQVKNKKFIIKKFIMKSYSMNIPQKILSLVIFLILLVWSVHGISQNVNVVKEPDMLRNHYRQEIRMPDIAGYQTLACDFHMHTVFSDGSVWPAYRVREAWMEGLDAIAITDHIEGQPSKTFMGGDQNASYEIARKEADKYPLMLIKGGEITRSMPPGHLNALFLEDIAAVEKEDPMAAIEEANKQGAFVFWNHPGWQAQQPDTNKWWDVHTQLHQKGWLHGIEVYNWDEWYPVAFDWCNHRGLAYMANSDIHIVASHRFNLKDYDRPMTLVFAKEKSKDAIKEALFARRTVARFLNQLAGPENLLRQLFHASIIIHPPFRVQQDHTVHVEITNPTDLMFVLENNKVPAGAPGNLTLHPGGTVIISCQMTQNELSLPYRVTNLHTGKQQVLEVSLDIVKKEK